VGFTPGFSFLDCSAGFGIAQHLIDYTEADTYPLDSCPIMLCASPSGRCEDFAAGQTGKLF